MSLIKYVRWWKESHRKKRAGEVKNTCYILTLAKFATNDQMTSNFTAQKMKFSIKDLCSKCDQIRRKPLMENLIFCAVFDKGNVQGLSNLTMNFILTLTLDFHLCQGGI